MARDAKVLNSRDVAWILNCGPTDVIELARSGELKGTKVGRLWQFRPKDVQAYQKKQKKEHRAAPISSVSSL